MNLLQGLYLSNNSKCNKGLITTKVYFVNFLYTFFLFSPLINPICQGFEENKNRFHA